ncbi:MAG: YkgJ family cysteine cluster protein [Saprospiraceae bacterium]|nr:YkgJ family cysteine cluster protein [Saprospiraceae bacterium]
MDILQFNEQSSSKKKENRHFFSKLKNVKSKDLDNEFHVLHDEVFESTSCLECANCCKTTSPMLFNTDIEKLAKSQKMKISDFHQKYIRVDDEGDYVFQSTPCPFLGKDNYCKVYNDRPKACREYPHTNRKNMTQILELTYKNLFICPAVFKIVEKLKASISSSL